MATLRSTTPETPTTQKRILLVEDEPEIRRLLALHLQDLGWGIAEAMSGEAALELLEAEAVDLVVLDVMLPGIDGVEVCRRLRTRPDYTPILMLTARSSELDRVLGLESGADDYLTKPFSIRELVARVKAIFRRIEAIGAASSAAEAERLEIRDLSIDLLSRTVRRRGRPIHLTAKEFDLLVHFARNPGRVYTRSELLNQVWGYGHDGYEHTVNSHINRLRSKIEDNAAEPWFVRTVWGVGYKFVDPRDLEEEAVAVAAPP